MNIANIVVALTVLVAALTCSVVAQKAKLGYTNVVETVVLTAVSLFGMLISAWAVQLAHGWWQKWGKTA
jgi:hypothetical protein